MTNPQAYARRAIDSLAFGAWRCGQLPEDLVKLSRGGSGRSVELKFNPNHDPTDGRFTFGDGGPSRDFSYTGMTANGLGVINPTSGGGADQNGNPVPEQFPPDRYALTNPATALAHYLGGSGEDRNFYLNNVDTSQVRLSNFPRIMELATSAKPGVYPISVATGAYNGDFTGLHDATSWATVGGLNLRVSGALVIAKDGQYRFSGNLSAGTDIYDFNPRRGRSATADVFTAIGRAFSGKSFRIHLIGSKPFNAGGHR